MSEGSSKHGPIPNQQYVFPPSSKFAGRVMDKMTFANLTRIIHAGKEPVEVVEAVKAYLTHPTIAKLYQKWEEES